MKTIRDMVCNQSGTMLDTAKDTKCKRSAHKTADDYSQVESSNENNDGHDVDTIDDWDTVGWHPLHLRANHTSN